MQEINQTGFNKNNNIREWGKINLESRFEGSFEKSVNDRKEYIKRGF